MATTKNTYTGNGSTTNYAFTFPYIKQADVKVSVDNVATTAFTFANATTVSFNTAPANSTAIAIYRATSDTGLVATFYPGSAIRSADLNDNYTQNLYSTQENTNDSTDALNNSRVLESGAYVSAITKAAAAVTTANTASTNASSAVTTANTASTNASSAVTTANTASTNATNAVTTANAADTIADSSKLATDRLVGTTANNGTTWTVTGNNTNASTDPKGLGYAITTADSATTTANTASTNASSAVTTANTASTNASAAVTTANTASTNASNAVTTANAAAADVAAAVLYTTVANKAALEALTPSEDGYYQVADSSSLANATWGTPTYTLSGIPGTYPSSALDGITTRVRFTVSDKTFAYRSYTVNDADNRYLAPGDLLDEDNMATNSATKVASQQSVKAYADTKQTLDADLTALSSCQTGAATALALLTATEVGVLDGVTSTTAELNLLDGVTSTTAELNYTDGVTSAIQTQIDTKAPLASPTFTGTVAIPNIANLETAVAANTAKVTNVATNLSVTANGTSLTVASSDGTDATIPAVTTSAWGAMTDEDKTKLDGIATSATANVGDAVLASDQNWTGAQRGNVNTLTSAASITIDFGVGNNFKLETGHGTISFANPTTEVAGQSGSIFIVQGSTTCAAPSWGNQYLFPGGTAPSLTGTTGKIARIDYIVQEAGKIHCVATDDLVLTS